MRTRNILVTAALLAAAWMLETPVRSQATIEAGCNRAMPDPVTYVPLPDDPLFVEATRDGCWLFVRTPGGMSILQRQNGTIEAVGRPIRLPSGGPLALTHDDAMLIARTRDEFVFFDVAKLIAGEVGPRLGAVASPRFGTATNAPGTLAVTPNGRHLISTHHWTSWLTMVDLEHVRTHGPTTDAIVAGTPTADLPFGVRVSQDGRLLYVSQAGPDGDNAPASECRPSYAAVGSGAGSGSGAISVIEISSLLVGEPALVDIVTSCSSIGLGVSPAGDRMYVAAQNGDALLAFDLGPTRQHQPPRLVGTVPIGPGPRDIVFVGDDRPTIVVAHGSFGESLRHAQDAPAFLTVIDAAAVGTGAAAVRGVIPTRSQVISLTVSADGRTLFAPNRFDQTLQVIDLDRLSLEAPPLLAGAR